MTKSVSRFHSSDTLGVDIIYVETAEVKPVNRGSSEAGEHTRYSPNSDTSPKCTSRFAELLRQTRYAESQGDRATQFDVEAQRRIEEAIRPQELGGLEHALE